MRNQTKPRVTRRRFIKDGATLGVGATALGGVATLQTDTAAQQVTRWDRVADVVVVGAGASGLCDPVMSLVMSGRRLISGAAQAVI